MAAQFHAPFDRPRAPRFVGKRSRIGGLPRTNEDTRPWANATHFSRIRTFTVGRIL